MCKRYGVPVAMLKAPDEYSSMCSGRSSFWEADVAFRATIAPAVLEGDQDILDKVRDPSPGREVERGVPVVTEQFWSLLTAA